MGNLKCFLYILCLVLFPILTSCDSDGLGPNSVNNDNGISLAISIDDFGKKLLSREATTDRTDFSELKDMNIILTDGNKVIKVFYVPSFSSIIANGEESGLISVNPVVYHISKEDMKGIKDIYVLGNNGDASYLQDKTVDFLLNQSVNNMGTNNVTTLFTKATPATEVDPHKGKVYNAPLKRLISIVTVQMKADGLNEGVVVEPTEIILHHTPVSCKLRDHNAPESTNEINLVGSSEKVEWEMRKLGQEGIKSIGGHGQDFPALIMFENMQGDSELHNNEQDGPNGGNYGDEIGKQPPMGKDDYCTYIEIKAIYTYTPTEGDNFISGNISYKLWLGNDIIDNFDINRNTHYKVTLTLSGMGGLREDGKIDDQGNFVADGKDLSWRIDTDVSQGGSFVGDVLNVASNGFYAYVPFQVNPDPNKRYKIIQDNDVYWIQAYSKEHSTWESAAEWSQPTIYKGSDLNAEVGLNLNPDLMYIKIYVQVWEEFAWPKGYSMEKWINEGFRDGSLILYEIDGNKETEVGKMIIRQWLPMPIVENVEDPYKANPYQANIYMSRIDVYEGVTLPWGPSSLNNIDLRDLNISKLKFADNEGMYPSMEYDPTDGFHRSMAIYQNDYNTGRNNIIFHEDEGRPNDALRVAIFRAKNAGSASNTPSYPNHNNSTYFYRIGLPTVEEWKKFKKFGIVDPKFPIAPDEYWTSTISSQDGTKSEVFSYFDGVDGSSRSAIRSERHRTRLIFHKNGFAQMQ